MQTKTNDYDADAAAAVDGGDGGNEYRSLLLIRSSRSFNQSYRTFPAKLLGITWERGDDSGVGGDA